MLARLLTNLTFLLGALALSPAYAHANETSKVPPVVLVDEVSGSYCTAFPVSSDGYLMTAVHCLKRCLDAQVGAEPVQCSGYSLPDLKTNRIQVVARGNILRQKTLETRFGDYAILKIETSKPLGCFALSESAAKPGEKLDVLGYPIPKRVGAKPSVKVNSGKLYSGPQESRYYRSRKSAQDKAEVSSLYALKDGVLYSSAHHLPGQSGGPVLDRSGKVVGVVSGYTVTRAGKAVIHEMVAGSTEKILANIPRSLSDQLIKKSRDCGTTRL